MPDSAFPWRLLSEPALAVHATSALPAWLWSADGRRLIFANPGGAAIFGAETCAAAVDLEFDAGHSATAQIAGIAQSLPENGAPRLQRLRGFGAGFGRTLTCLCRQVLHGDAPAVLVTAIDTAGPRLTLAERARRLFEGCDEAVAVYSLQNGLLDELLFATPGTEGRLSGLRAPTAADLAGRVEKLGEGENEVRILRLPEMESTADAPEPAEVPHETAESVDLSLIAEAIGEAQKAMAVERAAYEQAPDTIPDDASEAPAAEAVPNHPASSERRHPMRFVWTIDADNRFSIERGDFIAMIGPQIAAELNRPWVSIASDLDLDPEGDVARAIASRDTWSGITIGWPVDGSDERIAVELAGLPVYDRDRNFRGYRGFGVCRDLARVAALLAARKERDGAVNDSNEVQQPVDAVETRPPLSLVPQSENVVPFRPLSNDNNKTALNPVEQNAFQELASRLTARLKGADEIARGETLPEEDEPAAEIQPVATEEPPAQSSSDANVKHDRPLLDLLPAGILIYRHEHLFYANRAFLRWSGHDNVQDFAEAGGLDTLFIEPQADDNQTLRIAAPGDSKSAVSGHLLSIPWNGATAMMLVTTEAAPSEQPAQPVPAASGSGDLSKILEISTDGVVTFGRDGTILTANAGAERMLGYDSGQLTGLPFTNLFATESAVLVRNALQAGGTDRRADVIARTRRGETLPLQMSLAPLDNEAGLFCAAFQNLSRWKATERDLIAARRQAEAASSAKSDFLAKVSHEIRTPLNAIIGFSDVMMNERFGPVGNERYKEYLKDIHASGTHLVSLVNDLLDLSKIEAGKLDLSFEPLNLNDLTQQTVALMQSEASRERIIIRTSLAPELPAVVADVRSVKQIVLNLLSNSIKFTGAGGQVILSTACTDHGEAVLRVRDTGIGMSEKDIKTALEPFRQLATAARPDTHGTGLGLPLTKALVEANSARFSIKSAVNAGTLVEIVFPAVRAAE
jgi:PAS domain S-box-containing protein